MSFIPDSAVVGINFKQPTTKIKPSDGTTPIIMSPLRGLFRSCRVCYNNVTPLEFVWLVLLCVYDNVILRD